MHEVKPRKPRRRRQAQSTGNLTFPLEQIERWREELAAMPPPDVRTRPISKNAAVAMMAGELQALVERGYTTVELSELLKAKGLDVHKDTVRRALRQNRSVPAVAGRSTPDILPVADSAADGASEKTQVRLADGVPQYKVTPDSGNGRAVGAEKSTTAADKSTGSEAVRTRSSSPLASRSHADESEDLNAVPTRPPKGSAPSAPPVTPGPSQVRRTGDQMGTEASFLPRNDSDEI